jgi:hypothetical protein
MKNVSLVIGILLLSTHAFAEKRFSCKVSYQNQYGVKVENQIFEHPQNIELAGAEVRVTRYNSKQFPFHFFGTSMNAFSSAIVYKGKAETMVLDNRNERLEISCQDL